MADKGEGKALQGLLRKLEEFGTNLDDQERAALIDLVGSTKVSPARERVSVEEFRRALDFLAASRQGRFDLRRRDDDDGFWAQWAERQY